MKRTIILWISIILLILFLLCLPFFLLALSLRPVNTVVKTLDSPGGTYYAQVIESNHGALGGATYVEVYKSRGFLGWHKKVDRVYTGKWSEAQNMDIYWKDDRCLVINGAEYPIK